MKNSQRLLGLNIEVLMTHLTEHTIVDSLVNMSNTTHNCRLIGQYVKHNSFNSIQFLPNRQKCQLLTISVINNNKTSIALIAGINLLIYMSIINYPKKD